MEVTIKQVVGTVLYMAGGIVILMISISSFLERENKIAFWSFVIGVVMVFIGLNWVFGFTILLKW